MKYKDVVEAAGIIESLEGAKTLRATIKGGKHELRLYALTERDTIEDQIGVADKSLAVLLLNQIIIELETTLKNLGVE